MQLFTSGLPSTLTDDGSGNLTFTGRWINTRNSAADAPANTMTGTWFTGGTSTTTKPHFLIEPAGTTSNNWSTAGTGFGVNAPTNFLGDLAWFGINGSSRFVLGKSDLNAPIAQFSNPESSGVLVIRRTTNAQALANLGCDSSNPFLIHNTLVAGVNDRIFGLDANFTAMLPSGGGYSWCNVNAARSDRIDLVLRRDAANTLAQRNGVDAQATRIYNTFTSSTNFERLNIRWTSNEAIIDTEAGSGGGTLRGLKIGSASTSLLGFYGATPIAQGAAVADATDAATVITQLNALLARVRAVGLIAT